MPEHHRVLIVDDDAAIRFMLRGLLQDEGHEVLESPDAAHAYTSLDRQRVDAVLLDLRMPGDHGLDALVRIREQAPDTAVIIVSGEGTVEHALKAGQRGAFDFIEKPIDDARLVAAVREAIAYSSRAAPAAGTTRAPPGLDTLTRREREVLDLILAGRQTRAIADALFVTVKTVEFHRGRIYAKLGVASMAELFKLCFGPQPGDRVS